MRRPKTSTTGGRSRLTPPGRTPSRIASAPRVSVIRSSRQEVVGEQRRVVGRRGQRLARAVDEQALVIEEAGIALPLLEGLDPDLAAGIDVVRALREKLGT